MHFCQTCMANAIVLQLCIRHNVSHGAILLFRPPESGFGADTGSSTLPRIRTVPEEDVIDESDLASSSADQNRQPQQSMTAPASQSQNWRFSPINSPSGSPSDAVLTARSAGNGWRRTTSLRRTGSAENAGSLMPERLVFPPCVLLHDIHV